MLLRKSSMGVCLFLVGCGGAVDGREPGAEREIGSSADPLQTEFWTLGLGWHTSIAQAPLNGVIRFRAPTGENYSCGATFISPHFAITAAHCVDERDLPPGSTFRVEQYDLSQVTNDDLLAQAEVDGAWPSYFQPTPIPTTRHRVTSYTGCVPVAGCFTGELRKNCPFPNEVDIALVKCPTRPKTQGWASVHPQDRSNAQVEVFWFHELLTMDADPGAVEPTAPSGNWAHYGALDPNARTLNYHYSKPNHQMIPFRSSNWPMVSNPYTQLGHVTTELTMTDVPVCHGTSGAGVFERGTTGVFGVVATFGTQARVTGRLCSDMSANGDFMAVAPGQSLMGHTRRQFAAQLEALSMVQVDRQP